MTDDEKRARIVGVDPTERKVGIGASILAVALALYANVPLMVSKKSVVTTVKPVGKTCGPVVGITDLHYHAATKSCYGIYPANHYVLPLVVSLVLAVAIYVTVRIRRRAPLAFTMVMTGLAFGSLLVLVPYGVAGGWIMLRAWRTQRYGAPTAKAPIPGYEPPSRRSSPGAGSRAAGTRAGGSAGGRGRGKQSGAGARKAPEASKRYTPKAPKRRRPPPPPPE
jgi:hypothetical protein